MTELRIIAAAIMAAAKSLPICGGELVLNGGFDEVADGKTAHWNTIGQKFTYRDGAGMGEGRRGVCPRGQWLREGVACDSGPGGSRPHGGRERVRS